MALNCTSIFFGIHIAKTDFSETFRPRGSSSVTNSKELLFVTDEDSRGRNISLKSVFAQESNCTGGYIPGTFQNGGNTGQALALTANPLSLHALKTENCRQTNLHTQLPHLHCECSYAHQSRGDDTQ